MRTTWKVLGGVAGAAALALGLTACAGLEKAELGDKLLALHKNAALARHGVKVLPGKARIGGRELEAEFRYIHVPARPGASGAPILFLHGTPSTMTNWAALLTAPGAEPTREGECDVYVLEIVGHGQCRTQLDDYTFQACADWVTSFLAALDLRGVTVVGQSYGGEFAWRAALDAPERITKLVLLDSSGYRRGDGEWLPEEEKLREWPGAQYGYVLNDRERIRPALQLHFGVPIAEDQLDEMYLCCDNSDNWRAMTELCRDENGTREAEIAKIAQPTLLLWGERDIAYTPEKVAQRFARDIRGSRLALVRDAGHYPHEERVDDVRRELWAFHLGTQR